MSGAVINDGDEINEFGARYGRYKKDRPGAAASIHSRNPPESELNASGPDVYEIGGSHQPSEMGDDASMMRHELPTPMPAEMEAAFSPNALKGRTISVVAPPVVLLARRKLIEGFEADRAVNWVVFMRYFCVALSKVRPNACSNWRQALKGSQILGSVDSINA